jgi:hypothetical protein
LRDQDRPGAYVVTSTERFLYSNGKPAWSPDGRYLAYYSSRSDAGSAVLVIRTMETGEEREVLVGLSIPGEILDAKYSARSVPYQDWHGLRREHPPPPVLRDDRNALSGEVDQSALARPSAVRAPTALRVHVEPATEVRQRDQLQCQREPSESGPQGHR